jgi:nicotinate-nucleotide--dimethylbenzimidazole phosphoribosyltransferase
VTGRGTGIDDATLAKKIAVVAAAIERHAPRKDDPIGVLAAVGGFEIGAIAGACLGAAATGKIAVIDGFISTAGAALAAMLSPQAVAYMVAATRSVEPGHGPALEEIPGLRPLLDLGLRLGEATGAVLALPIIDGALAAFREMATFESAGVSDRT